MIILLLIVAIALGVFYGILQLAISGVWKFALIFIEMALVSQLLIRQYKLSSELGLVLLKSKKGIEIIEKLAQKDKVFNLFADIGSSISYGLLSFVLMRKTSSVATVVSGLLILAFLSFLVAPTAFIFLFQVLKVGAVDKSVTGISNNTETGLLIVGGILLIGGLFLFILSGIIFYGAVIFNALVKSIFLGSDAISNTAPGGTFLLPGVNLPLFEGVIALAIVMVVHEGAHAVLARIAKVPILSSGIVLFGIIPVGAFVEPDEKKLSKVEESKQTRVLVAGATSNLFTSCAFFLMFMGVVMVINNFGLMQSDYAPVVMFIYLTLGLTFALNFIVGAVNLLPVPLFDGYRIIDVNIKNKIIVKALMYVTLFFFILNFLPWFFQR